MNAAQKILEDLNPAQREAAETASGPLLVLAGPGSGKTRVIAHRIAYLIKVVGIPPARILAVTFTNKAAQEMQERISNLVGEDVRDITLGTFHKIAARFLRADGSRIGLDPHFVIYDEEDQLDLVRRALEDLDLDPAHFPPKNIKQAISAAKVRLIGPYEYEPSHYFEEIVKRVYLRYQELLEQSNALDFDDLLMKVVELLRRNPEVLAKYQTRYLHVLIDEFQDTNYAQYMFAKLVSGKHRNLCVVGDPNQSIYSWRYADLRHILDFERDFPDAKVVYLEQNYRSTRIILEVANELIKANEDRRDLRLWTENEEGEPVVIYEAENEHDEARFVASEVERLLREGYEPKDIAVMYRANAQSRVLEEAFLRYGIPYRIVGGIRFYERREIKDLLAYLRLLVNPCDETSFLRIINTPPRGIGPKTVGEIVKLARKEGRPLFEILELVAEGRRRADIAPRSLRSLQQFHKLLQELRRRAEEKPVSELLKEIIELVDYRAYILNAERGEERWENVLELLTVAEAFRDIPAREGIPLLLENAALISDVDELDERANAVTLITLHQAKGLEFPAVFIVGAEEGLLPHYKSLSSKEQIEEERRLCYVGITRAKKKVYLSYALRRSTMGGSFCSTPSRFLQEIPEHLTTSPAYGGAPRRCGAGRVPPAYKAGDRVYHAKFGEGVILECVPIPGDYEITVFFEGGAGVKKLLASLAPMRKI